jgi:hypothetical protein
MPEKENKGYSECIREFTMRLQEHCMEYCLEKTMKVKTLNEYQELLKKEISNLHRQNMGIMDCKINSK